MQKFVIGMVLALGMLAGVPAASAVPISADMRGAISPEIGVEFAQYMGKRYCARLRRACEFKGQRGEVGEGNCRRYRSECGERVSNCERLRRACFNKEARGEVGQGNCRQYRAQCGRSRLGSR
jgi:hypothetical protein